MSELDQVRIGWIGLGKLGLPCALVQAMAGFRVCGTDVNHSIKTYLQQKAIPYEEQGVNEALRAGHEILWYDSVAEVVENSDLVFIATQTPHDPRFEGCDPVPNDRRDFEYGFLKAAVLEATQFARVQKVFVVVSTTLPGTCEREITPIVARNQNVHFVYSPAFIAMGTTMHDFQNPEMVIMGSASSWALEQLALVHKAIHDAPIIPMQIVECELVKMCYNTFIGMKIVFANALGEICDNIGGDADMVVDALSHATTRIISDMYMRPGLGDGGGCHPRDQLALSYLASRTEMSIDIFGWLMHARDEQTRYIARIIEDAHHLTGLPVVICGAEYKPGTQLTVGSPSRLLKALLKVESTWFDGLANKPGVYVIGVASDENKNLKFPKGSFVIDPFGVVTPQDGVIVKTFGRRR